MSSTISALRLTSRRAQWYFYLASWLCLINIPIIQAHDIPVPLLEYALKNPQASFSEFQSFALQSEYAQLWEQSPIAVILDLPGKKNITRALLAESDLSLEKVSQLIASDPMLIDISADVIYQFITNQSSPQNAKPKTSITKQPSMIVFIWLGIHHIFIGWDHILFILSLLLLLPAWRPLIIMLAVFTLAHSITLALSSLGWLIVNNKLVEPLIALSIVLVAAQALRGSIRSPIKNSHLWIVGIFGLFHGLGFAQNISLYIDQTSVFLLGLLGFNIGIELAQLFIILLVYPALYWLYNRNNIIVYKNAIASILIIVGLYWVIGHIWLN